MDYSTLSVRKKILIAGTSVVVLMLIGTIFYHSTEKWSWTDSFYFTGITLTTIGYGDLYPTTQMTKIATVFFAFVGIGMVLFFFTIMAEAYIEHQEKNFSLNIQHYTDELRKLGENNRKKLKERKNRIIRGTKI